MASFNDLLVLNAEMAALVRAGIPLELGLRRLSQTLSGRLGALAERVAVRLESGQSLDEAVRLEGASVSPLYAAVIEAGLRSNRLPHALEGLVRFGRTLQEARRRITLALLYPAIVTVVAYLLLVTFVVFVAPGVFGLWDPWSPLTAFLVPLSERIRDTAIWWGPALPLLVYGGLRLSSWLGRAWSDLEFLAAEPGGRGLSIGAWIPGVPRLYQDLDRGHSVRALGLLLEHALPLPTALHLVSRMTGSRQLAAAYRRLGEGVVQGRSLAAEVHVETRLPTLIAQLLRSGAAESDLPDALAKAADIYDRRAMRKAAWLRSVLPPLFAVVVGGTVTLAYALAFGLPLRWFFLELLSEI